LLIGLIVVGAMLMLVGLGIGSVRMPVVPDGSNEGWGEWRSYAVESWFIPVLASLAVFGLAHIALRGRPLHGVALGAAALLAALLAIAAEPDEVVLDVNVIAELGYLGIIILGVAGPAMVVAEPILAIYERRELELRDPGLPIARVVR
jgi:hypothetical protein